MSVVAPLVVVLLVVLAAWLWLRQHPNAPPELSGALPIIGHSYQFLGDRKHLWKFFQKIQIASLAKGGVIRYWAFTHTFYVVTDPEDALTVSNSCLSKPYIYDFAKDQYKNGLITAEPSIWKVHRKLLNPAFNQQVLNTYVNEMNVQARSLVSQLAPKAGQDPFDVRKFFVNYTMSTVTRTSLGLNTQEQTIIVTDYAKAIEDLFAIYCDRFTKVWLHVTFLFDWSAMKRKQTILMKQVKNILDPDYLETSAVALLQKIRHRFPFSAWHTFAGSTIDSLFIILKNFQIIRKRRSELKANMYDDSTPDKFKPVLDQMLHLADEQDAFTDDDIREHLDTLVAAAYDTTSSALTLILITLGTHRDLQDRLYNELREVLEHKNDIMKEDLPKLVYLDAVIKEVLRLYPSGPMVARNVNKDVVLKNCTLRAGSTCGLGLYGLLRHPLWGADADQFRPERWLDPASLPQHPSLYASFGVGKRNCIGKVYSLMTMKIALAHILWRYYITGDINNVVCEYDIVLKPVEGNLVSLTPRT